MTGTLGIRTWTAADVSFAKRMTDVEQWGNSENDFRRLLKIQPDGCFVVLIDEQRVGMISAVAYGSFGFLGSLIVLESYRGHGIGERLMRHAIDFLRSKDVSTIELDGVLPAVPLYRRLGFKDKYHSLRFQRPANSTKAEFASDTPSGACRALALADIVQVIRFDREALGFDRSRVIQIVAQEFPSSFYGAFDANNALNAYLCARPIAESSRQLGPLLSNESSVAIDLLSQAVKDHPSSVLSIGLPESSAKIADWLPMHGFIRHSPSLRMYLGDEINNEAKVVCILSPEKG